MPADYRVELNPLTNLWHGYFLNRPGWAAYGFRTGEEARKRMDEVAALGEKGEYTVWHNDSGKFLWRRSDNTLTLERPESADLPRTPAPPRAEFITLELTHDDFSWLLYSCGKTEAHEVAEQLIRAAATVRTKP